MKTHFLTLLVAGAVSALGQQPRVVINELLYLTDSANPDPNRSSGWVELYNAGQAGVDLTGWKITAHDGKSGASARPLPNVTLPAGSYLVVHFATGTSSLNFSTGSGTYYTNDNPASPYWNSASDEAALYSTTGIVDFVAWSRIDLTYQPGQASNDAVAAGIWTSGVAVVSDWIGRPGQIQRILSAGRSIGRDSLSTDTNWPDDFDAHGGPDADDISPGRRNLDMHTVISPAVVVSGAAEEAHATPETTAPAKKPWTVMLYFIAGHEIEVPLWNALHEIQNYGGSNSNVNFVVLFGGKNTQYAAGLNSVGTPTMFSNPGGNFRGLITAPNPADNVALTLQAPSGAPDLPSQDMGDPATLTDFVTWAQANYPANHYALIFGGHGDGWKGFGPDDRFLAKRLPSSSQSAPDFMYMGEFLTALGGFHFDVVAFNSCLMGELEVAYQFQQVTDWFVASEEVMQATDTFSGLNYASLAAALRTNPGLGGKDVGTHLVEDFQAYWAQQNNPRWSLSLVDESQVKKLVMDVSPFASSLYTGVTLLQNRGDASDNGQVLIAQDAGAIPKPSGEAGAHRFFDPNYMDLYDFANQIGNDSRLPSCVTGPAISVILDLTPSKAVPLEVHSPAMPTIGGLSIYMPVYRSGGPHLIVPGNGKPMQADTYDYVPISRVSDGGSQLTVYAFNYDYLPQQAKDMETGQPFFGFGPHWPAPATNLNFTHDSEWSVFLRRYYHPVADNHIVGASAKSDSISPSNSSGAGCGNSEDFIAVPKGFTVTLTAGGSSDVDMAPLLPPGQFTYSFNPVDYNDPNNQREAFSATVLAGQSDTPNGIQPLHYMWDKDGSTGCMSKCQQPTDINGADASTANTHMDQDRIPQAEPTSQKDADLIQISITCNDAGFKIITNLMPWDDNHLYSFHNTIPSGAYVHPQTDGQQSIIECVYPADYISAYDTPSQFSVGDTTSQMILVGSFAGGSGNDDPLSITVTGGITATANGITISGTGGSAPDVLEPRASSAPVQVLADRSTGALNLAVTGVAPGPASVSIHALGTSLTQVLNFTVSPKPAITPTDLQVTAPGPVAVLSNGTVTAVVRNNGQPVAGAWVTFLTASSLVTFSSGTPFHLHTGTQVQTDATGTAQATFTGISPGPFTLTVSTGPLSKTVSLSVAGTVPSTPAYILLSGVPQVIQTGTTQTLTATVYNGGETPLPGVSLAFSVGSGDVQIQGSSNNNPTLTSDANGTATINFTATDNTPVGLYVAVPGTQILASVHLAVDGIPVSTTPPVPPQPAGVIPAAGAGTTETLSFTFVDPRGSNDLGVVNILINNFLDGRAACYLAYSQPLNVLYLVNDAGNGLLNGVVLNGTGSVSNSQCGINGASSSATAIGNALILSINFTFSTAFAGNKVMYLASRDVANNNSGWVPSGVWQVPGGVSNITTAVVGMDPAAGESDDHAFTFTFTDAKGYLDIGVVNVLVNDYLNGGQACYIAYSQPSNAVYLVNDAGTALSAGLVLNGAGSVSNSQCTIIGAGSSATGSGNALILTLNITFGSGFAGNRIFYLAVRDVNEGNNTGWQSQGAWIVE